MKTNHTKDEWKVLNEGLEDMAVICKKTKQRICWVKGWDHLPPTYEQDEANAKLIAAAPDLLEALKFAVFLLDKDCDGVATNMMKKAIKKATS